MSSAASTLVYSTSSHSLTNKRHLMQDLMIYSEKWKSWSLLLDSALLNPLSYQNPPLFLLLTLIISTSILLPHTAILIYFIIFWTSLPKTCCLLLSCFVLLPHVIFFSDKIKRILQHLGLQLPPSISSEFPPTTDYFSYFLLPPHQKPLIQYVWPLSRVAVAVPRINVWDLWTEDSIASATLETTTSLACDGGLKPEEGTDHLGKTGSER